MVLVVTVMRTATWEQDPEKQKELFNKAVQEHVQPHVEIIEKHLIKNGSGYLVGQGVCTIYNCLICTVVCKF